MQHLDTEIAANENELARLEAEARALREEMSDRAALAYRRAGSGLDLTFGLEDGALEPARRQALLGELNESDDEVADELADVAESVEDERDRLAADREVQAETVARVKAEEDALNTALVEAQAHRGYVAAQQALAARQAAERASSGAGPPNAEPPSAEPPPPPPGYNPTPGEHPQHNHPFLVCTRGIESGGNYQAYNGAGPYYGAYQFLQSTWNATANHAGRGELVGLVPSQASAYDQDDMAWVLYQWQGSRPWNGRCD